MIEKASSSSEKKASSSERKAAKEGNKESRSSRESSQQAGLSASSCHVTAPERHRAAARQRVVCVVLDLRDTSQDYQTCYPNFSSAPLVKTPTALLLPWVSEPANDNIVAASIVSGLRATNQSFFAQSRRSAESTERCSDRVSCRWTAASATAHCLVEPAPCL